MGFFQHDKPKKQSPKDKAATALEGFLNADMQAELLAYGRSYFETIINETAAVFKQDLNATVGQINVQLQNHVTQQLDTAVAQVNVELKDRVAKQLENQFAEYNQQMKASQDLALASLTNNSQQLQAEYQELRTMLQKNVADQKVTLTNVFEENKVRIAEMKQAQDLALQSLNDSARALQDQYAQINKTLQENVAAQEEALVTSFQENMASIVEHYLFDAVGEQYDLKSQLPSIIRQMEENKQAIVDDMKL